MKNLIEENRALRAELAASLFQLRKAAAGIRQARLVGAEHRRQVGGKEGITHTGNGLPQRLIACTSGRPQQARAED